MGDNTGRLALPSTHDFSTCLNSSVVVWRVIRTPLPPCNTICSRYVSIQRGIISIGRSCILASTRVFRCRTALTQVTRTRVKPDR